MCVADPGSGQGVASAARLLRCGQNLGLHSGYPRSVCEILEYRLEERQAIVDTCKSFAVNWRDDRARIIGIAREAQQTDLPSTDGLEQREFIGSADARCAFQIETTF